MGILLAFMFIWNMLGALLLLPALAHFLLPQAKPAAEVSPSVAVDSHARVSHPSTGESHASVSPSITGGAHVCVSPQSPGESNA
jgi:UDP-3-O-[3-hydroxymyristoyl] glucosamine N-acyltransferase